MSGETSGYGVERLDSWKAIAAYLGRDEGTLRRWERTRGLPIRRLPGRKGGSVYAYTSEIDAWLQADPPESGPEAADDPTTPPDLPPATEPAALSRPSIWVAAPATLIAAFVAGWLLTRPAISADALRLELTDTAVTGRDANGRAQWTHQLGEEFRHIVSDVSESSRLVHGARPRAYVATAIRFRRSDNFVAGGRLMAFDLDGTPRWRFEFDDDLNIGGQSFGAPWGVTAFAVDDGGTERRIAVAAHHYTWSASMVTILDDEGRRKGTYVNDGWLEQVLWLAPDRLAVGGFHESMNGGMVAVIDPASLDGQTPESDPAHRCLNCGGGRPLRVAVMPRTELNLVTGARFNRARLVHGQNQLVVRTVEVPASDQPPAEAIYEFTPGLDPLRASFSARYWELHDQLYASRRLDHDRASCPDRDGPPPIHVWTPESGWRMHALK